MCGKESRPGLNCSGRLYEAQASALWRFGPVTVARHTEHDSMQAIAAGILATAPPRFALAGLSMGGYIAFEIVRQAHERVAALALLDTSARPDTPQQSERRDAQIAMAREGRFAEVSDLLWPVLVHRDRQDDADLKAVVRLMADETGPDAFIRQQTAIKTRPDSRPDLADIRCPCLVIVGDGDTLTPPELAREMADGIPGAGLVTVPGSGHLSTLERPEAVNAGLASLMERVAAS
ncbi:MAG: alpha/beta fold hydrolase [Rhizobiales bacterium]|nr:alpha/beta fold hydrolase [Hyphomicrobiales bacterium]